MIGLHGIKEPPLPAELLYEEEGLGAPPEVPLQPASQPAPSGGGQPAADCATLDPPRMQSRSDPPRRGNRDEPTVADILAVQRLVLAAQQETAAAVNRLADAMEAQATALQAQTTALQAQSSAIGRIADFILSKGIPVHKALAVHEGLAVNEGLGAHEEPAVDEVLLGLVVCGLGEELEAMLMSPCESHNLPPAVPSFGEPPCPGRGNSLSRGRQSRCRTNRLALAQRQRLALAQAPRPVLEHADALLNHGSHGSMGLVKAGFVRSHCRVAWHGVEEPRLKGIPTVSCIEYDNGFAKRAYQRVQ
ncbi:hypothetical protein ISCGN_013688 [Ixodes scapularis]